MKQNTLLLLLAGLVLTLIIPNANAQQRATSVDIPRTISYQGLLQSADGKLAEGPQTVSIRLYADPNAATPVWQDEFTTDVRAGILNLQLGSQKALPDAAVLNAPLWVAVKIGDNNELRPMVPLSASPYALNVANNSITADKLATNYVASVSINGQKITGKGSDLNIITGDGISMKVDPVTNSLMIQGDATTSGTSSKGSTIQTNTSIIGTSNQVFANGTVGSGNAQTGNVTLTLPQSIATSSSPSFADLTLSGKATSSATASGDGSSTLTTKGYVDAINTSLTNSINSEASSRTSADNTLTTNLNAEVSRAQGAESTLTTNLNNEISNRQSAVTSEANARTSADNTLTTNLSTEVTRAQAAEGTLTTNLASEVSNRQAAVTAETNARTSADNTLTTNLNTEVSRAQGAESTLTTNLNNEIANRQTAVTGEATARTSADNTLTSNLSAEVTRAEAAESTLTTAVGNAATSTSLNAEISRAQAAEGTLTTNLNSEITNRQAAVTSEASSRTSADNALTTSINNEVTNRTAAVASEAATRASAVNSLTTNLNNEISARQSAVTSEASTRSSADAALSAALSAETAARMHGDSLNDVGNVDLDMHGHYIVNVSDPADPQNVATKNYVDLSTATIFRDYTGFGDGNYTGHNVTVYGSEDNVVNLIGYSSTIYGTDDDNIGIQTNAFGLGGGNAIGGDFNALNLEGTGTAIGGRFSASGAGSNVAVMATSGSIDIASPGEGLILKSPGGNCFEITVDDYGNLTTTAVACP